EPLCVSAETDTGILIDTENPAEVGADRIVNAAAVVALGALPAIVIDMGTATTFDVVLPPSAPDQLPALAGVVITAGLRVAADALASRAAQLSRVALEAPPRALGRNTIHAVQSGLVFGYVGLVEGLVRRLSAELNITPTVIGTGGLINIIAPHTDCIDQIEPWLTLGGLRAIGERSE
ncbi:MAG TPA: type III pantothenate kinase, partial [Anaerolineae bacterium]|nr:type III pantothenate kinase [Anaerolineae bacterium]